MHVFFQLALASWSKISSIVLAGGRGYHPRDISTKIVFKDVVIFGDSITDNGNVYRFTNETWPADPAYYKGRFSNGPVWIEDLASTLGLKLHDFAMGGSTSDNKLVQGYTGPNSTIAVPSAVDQVSQYIGNGTHMDNMGDTLFGIFIGGNDALFDANATGAETARNIVSMMKDLSENGATYFLLASYPNLSRLPYQAYVSPATNQRLAAYSTELRTSLRALAGTNVAYADFYQLFDDIFANPDRYGYDRTETTKSCLTGVYHEAPRHLCDDPDKYIFWDEYHPTRKTHRLVAAFAEKAIRSKFSLETHTFP